MRLTSVYGDPDAADLLWLLLAEREPHQNISHRKMPTWPEHVAFIQSRPYPHWYLIDVGADMAAGAVYLTDRREVGVGILRRFRGRGLGKAAVSDIVRLHPGPLLANINPQNASSIALFHDLGFKLVQQTYRLEAA